MVDCGRLLSMIEHRGAAGLEACVLRLRASVALRLRRLDVAEADVSTALAAMPGDVASLLLQAEVGLREMPKLPCRHEVSVGTRAALKCDWFATPKHIAVHLGS
jgi:hypothetical protein